MSAETTPALDRAQRLLFGHSAETVREVIAAVLDVEEMACALYISDHPYDTSEQWRDHGSERAKDIYRTLARAIRTALLGADS